MLHNTQVTGPDIDVVVANFATTNKRETTKIFIKRKNYKKM